MSVAIANIATATVRQMDEGTQQWRQERLKALAKELGGKAALGRALGYVDGAFVGQMISGLRPITEKTVAAAEAIRGPKGQSFRGWFTPHESSAPAPAQVPMLFEAPTADEMELLDNFRHMLDHDREELAAEIAKRAARAKADIDAYIKRFGLTPRPASASAKAAAEKARTTATAPRHKDLDVEPRK